MIKRSLNLNFKLTTLANSRSSHNCNGMIEEYKIIYLISLFKKQFSKIGTILCKRKNDCTITDRIIVLIQEHKYIGGNFLVYVSRHWRKNETIHVVMFQFIFTIVYYDDKWLIVIHHKLNNLNVHIQLGCITFICYLTEKVLITSDCQARGLFVGTLIIIALLNYVGSRMYLLIIKN